MPWSHDWAATGLKDLLPRNILGQLRGALRERMLSAKIGDSTLHITGNDVNASMPPVMLTGADKYWSPTRTYEPGEAVLWPLIDDGFYDAGKAYVGGGMSVIDETIHANSWSGAISYPRWYCLIHDGIQYVSRNLVSGSSNRPDLAPHLWWVADQAPVRRFYKRTPTTNTNIPTHNATHWVHCLELEIPIVALPGSANRPNINISPFIYPWTSSGPIWSHGGSPSPSSSRGYFASGDLQIVDFCAKFDRSITNLIPYFCDPSSSASPRPAWSATTLMASIGEARLAPPVSLQLFDKWAIQQYKILNKMYLLRNGFPLWVTSQRRNIQSWSATYEGAVAGAEAAPYSAFASTTLFRDFTETNTGFGGSFSFLAHRDDIRTTRMLCYDDNPTVFRNGYGRIAPAQKTRIELHLRTADAGYSGTTYDEARAGYPINTNFLAATQIVTLQDCLDANTFITFDQAVFEFPPTYPGFQRRGYSYTHQQMIQDFSVVDGYEYL